MGKMLKLALAALTISLWPNFAFALDKVVLGINWAGQASWGGFYQAIADGTYEKHGIDVEIMTGGPQVNLRPMLPAGRLDFLLTPDLLTSFDNATNNIPTMAIAQFGVKNPTSLITHKGAYKDFKSLVDAPTVMMTRGMQITSWRWMVTEFGFREEQLKPYHFSMAEFLSDPKMVQQAYAMIEPNLAAAKGVQIDTYILADYGYDTYGTVLMTRNDLIEKNADLVQRFVDASIEGWYTFLYGDNSKGSKAIMDSNADMTAEELKAEVKLMRDLGIIDGAETLDKGIGAIDMARVKHFLSVIEKAGLYKKGEVDLAKAVTDRFVNKGVGLDIKKANAK